MGEVGLDEGGFCERKDFISQNIGLNKRSI